MGPIERFGSPGKMLMPGFGQTKWNWLRMPPSLAGPICVEYRSPTWSR